MAWLEPILRIYMHIKAFGSSMKTLLLAYMYEASVPAYKYAEEALIECVLLSLSAAGEGDSVCSYVS